MAGSEIITLEYVELYDEWLPKSQVEDIRESCDEVDIPL